jgi:RNA polymerase sigma factor (sigma-70 family)
MRETLDMNGPFPAADGDAALVAAIASGRRDAFTLAFHRYRSDVYRFARHMTGDADVADDVTQDTFLTLMQAPERFDPTRGALRAYLLGIARNLVARRLRDQRWWAPPALDAAVEPPTNDEGPFEQLCRATDVARVQGAVEQLATPFRDTLVLCDLLGLSYEEAAASLACPIGTVRSRLFRARRLLADALAADTATSKVEEGVKRCLA